MSEGAATWRLADMHCHLDKMANAEEVAEGAAAGGVGLFCTTVTPEDAVRARARFTGFSQVRVGIGMHPWWVTDDPGQGERTKRAAELAAASPYVGEIGLDFSPSHADTRAAQLAAFECIVRTCVAHPRADRVLSIHAVRSAGAALDILERHGMAGRACIFHWFSGTSDDLSRLRRLGCCVSVNEHMLGTKRGREYARQIPTGQLLIETDAPPKLDAPYSLAELTASLDRTLTILAQVRDVDKDELTRAIAQTSSKMLFP